MYIALTFKPHRFNKWRHHRGNLLQFNEPPNMYDLFKAQVECLIADLWDLVRGR